MGAGDYPTDVHWTVAAHNDPDFDGFVQLLTDGVSAGQEIRDGAWGHNGPRLSGGADEETWFRMAVRHVPGLGPDLVGYEITEITFEGAVIMESDWPGPTGHIYKTHWAYGGDYRFYGNAIPEPTTLILLGIGAMLTARRGRQRKRSRKQPESSLMVPGQL